MGEVFFSELSLPSRESGPFKHEANRLNHINYLELFKVIITLWHSVQLEAKFIVYDGNEINQRESC